MSLRTLFGGMIPLFVLGHFCHHIMTAITVPLMPYIRSDFNLDYTQSGMVVSAFTLAYGFSQLPAGWLADRVERRLLLTVSISGVALAGILVGLSQSYLLLFLFLVLMGILAGGYHPSAPPLIMAAVRREHLGSAMGFHNIGGSASNVVTPLLAMAVANALGWRNAYIALAVPMVAFGLLFHVLLGRMTAQAAAAGGAKASAPEEARPNGTRQLVTFLFLSILTFAVLISTYAFVPLLMVDHFQVSKETAAASLAVIYSGGLWGNPLGGWLADRLGSIRVILAVCLIAGPALFLVTQVPYGWGLAALFLVMGFVVFARMSASEAYLVRRTSARNRSTILGIYFFAGQEGGAMLTPLMGYLIDRLGFTLAYGLAGGLVLVTTLVCGVLLWEEGKKKEL